MVEVVAAVKKLQQLLYVQRSHVCDPHRSCELKVQILPALSALMAQKQNSNHN